MIRIVTDSASDITFEEAKQLNVEIMPLSVRFGENSYISGVNITIEEYYRRLEEEAELPTTAQVNPYEFEKKYKSFLDQGDEIVSIQMSSELSGTYQSAVIAKNNLESDRIYLVDSKNVCSALGLLVMLAVKMRDEGSTAKEIAQTISSYVPKLRLYVLLDTLEYVKKGGRISPTVAFIGEKLKLHPMVAVVDGKIEVADKVKGKKAAIKSLIRKVNEGNKNPDLPMMCEHANVKERGEELLQALKDDGHEDVIECVCMGPIIGTYSGPGALGVFFIEK